MKVCPTGSQICDERGRFLDWTTCTGCLECAAVCPTGALSVYGQEMTAEQLLQMILRDKPFYRKSGGGVTFSGGEPLLQAGFLREVLKLCKAQGLHTAIDTAGNVRFESVQSVLPYTDLFLYDIKAFDRALHLLCTGTVNTRILANLQRLNDQKARIWVRLPYIPGINHGQDEIRNIAASLRNLPFVEKVELLPYHAYGEAKYEQLGVVHEEVDLRPPTQEEVWNTLDAYKAQGLHVDCSTVY